MVEPSTTTNTVLVATGVSMATLLPGIDGNALVGAFAGAALVAVHTRELSFGSRLLYLLISWIIGYLAAPEVAHRLGLIQTGVSSFLAAALAIAITVQLLERIKTIDITAWLRRGGP